jgi:cold shock CspA family protein
MAKSKETYNKKEKEKKRLKLRMEKKEKMEQRKVNASKKSLDDMIAYIDEDGNLSDTPPDPKKKKIFNAEDIVINIPQANAMNEADRLRNGVVSFFNNEKGFGFIQDSKSGERVFVHINQLTESVKENDRVSFEAESGPRGLSAVNIKKL